MNQAYYNEFDRFAAAWLRELIKANLIAPGEVDERSIVDVQPEDLRGFTQCHFFAGIGVWSYALRAAGWADDSPVWTGSCPCQSFSASGKRGGFSDQRHLWPSWFRLIRECRPNVCFGEQVASKDGLAWLDVVSSDVEGEGYAIGACDTCAAGFGAPMLSQRLYFVAEAASERCGEARRGSGRSTERSSNGGESGRMDATEVAEWRRTRRTNDRGRRIAQAGGSGIACELGASEGDGRNTWRTEPAREQRRLVSTSPGSVNGFWSTAEWIWCRDEKFRPIEPGTFPLAYESPARVGRLRGYGNAIVAEQAKAFIESYMEISER